MALDEKLTLQDGMDSEDVDDIGEFDDDWDDDWDDDVDEDDYE